jgi:phosphoribosylaminoimidazolecarboxamide formyltransferase/IMP cyclohydrolase
MPRRYDRHENYPAGRSPAGRGKGIGMAVNYVTTIDDRVRIQNVLASVYDKEGLGDFAAGLLRSNPECRFFATGNTHHYLKDALGTKAARHLVTVEEFTGQPEMQGGLVKTLDFKIYLALLSETYNRDHQADVKERTGGVAFDMVVSNLYPFEQTVAAADVTVERARANIDIGGPCLIRAAAKNFHRVAVVTDKTDYGRLLEILASAQGTLDVESRFTLARKAFDLIARYDAAVAEYLMNAGSEKMRRCYSFPKKGA